MLTFRAYLAVLFLCIVGYTGLVVYSHGWNLFPVFFGDMAKMTWAGQFNFDFMMMLSLSGLWIAWRHRFSPLGIVLGVLGVLGGIMFLSLYLLIVSFKSGEDMKILLLGEARG